MLENKFRKLEILKSIELYLIDNKSTNIIDSYNDWSINYFKELLTVDEAELAIIIFNTLSVI